MSKIGVPSKISMPETWIDDPVKDEGNKLSKVGALGI